MNCLFEDVKVVLNRDPSIKTVLEAIICSPGVHALFVYRISHWFYNKKWYFTARFLAQLTRLLTGIEIHPGAKIGRRLFIDHGCGVVIGETTEIGDDVMLFQNVTLGGTGKGQGKRHPNIGNNVMISAGANILGPINIGDNSKIGAGAVIIKDIPPNVTVVGIPGRIVIQNGIKVNRENEPDGFLELVNNLDHRLKTVETKLVMMKKLKTDNQIDSAMLENG